MCKFCEEYKAIRACNPAHDKEYGIRRYFKCAIVVQSFKNKGFRGQYTGRTQKLRYCPECGKDLKQ